MCVHIKKSIPYKDYHTHWHNRYVLKKYINRAFCTGIMDLYISSMIMHDTHCNMNAYDSLSHDYTLYIVT